MSSRWVNLAIFAVSVALLASGILLFTTNRAQDAWLYGLHRYSGVVLLALLVPKTRIVWRALARQWRRGSWFNPTTLAAGALTGLLLLSLALALAWTFELLPFYVQTLLYTTPLELHWYVDLALAPFLAFHVVKRWPLPARRAPLAARSRQPLVSRRDALSLIGLSALGLVGFGALDTLAARTSWIRRFTGSREVSSFQGNDFPVTSSDAVPAIDVTAWRLRIGGKVARPFELTYADVLALASDLETATVDCTLGWASTQNWRGIRLSRLMERAGVAAEAREVTLRGITGAFATLSLDEARASLLATHVEAEPLNPEHGFPARLVAPTRRGYHWIKWMNELVVS